MKMRLEFNKNALSSVESRLFVDKIRSEEVNRARAFVTRGEGAFSVSANDCDVISRMT